jgi:hypothetical protein
MLRTPHQYFTTKFVSFLFAQFTTVSPSQHLYISFTTDVGNDKQHLAAQVHLSTDVYTQAIGETSDATYNPVTSLVV